MKKIQEINKIFSIKDTHKFKDLEGKELELASSPDVKGILGGDRRKYVLDIMRLSPRDLNWKKAESEEEYNSCVFRLTLIKNYLMSKRLQLVQSTKDSFNEEIENNKKDNLVSIQEAIQKRREEAIESNKDKKEEDKVQKVELTDEEKKTMDLYNKNNEEIGQKIDEKVKAIIESEGLSDCRFNPVISTGTPGYLISDEEKAKEEKDLQEISEFAKTEMVTKLVTDWS